MVKGYDDDNQFNSTDRLLKALNLFEKTNQRNRRDDLLRLVKSQYEDLYSNLDAVPHPVFGNRG